MAWETPRWLTRFARAVSPDRVEVSGVITPVAVVQQSYGAYSRYPLSRCILATANYGANAGENGLMQITPRAGFDVLAWWFAASAAHKQYWGAADLTGTLTDEDNATEHWSDRTWTPNEPGVIVLEGTIATASLPAARSTLSLPMSSNQPFSFGISQPPIAFAQVRDGDRLTLANITPGTSGSVTALLQAVRNT